MNHSIKFPLPLNFHIGFVIFSVIMLILCYKRRRYAYDLYMLIGIAATMLIYIAEPKPVFYALGLAEIILLIMTIVDMIIVAHRNAAIEKAREEREEQEAMEKLEEAALYDFSNAENTAISENITDTVNIPEKTVPAADTPKPDSKPALSEDMSEFVCNGTGGMLSGDTIVFEPASDGAVLEKPEETAVNEESSEILYKYEPEPEKSEETVANEESSE
ncbi:MAG: hypothetical protein K2N72_01520, partial [Oscillospiraceae bacterium]|nr:hypothetical protein [Oscillospiraceae bacterium]